MAFRFATVAKDKILAVNELKQLHQQIPSGKRQNLACRCLLVDRKKISYLIYNKMMKNDSPKHCQLKRKQTLTEWRLLFTKSSFLIFIQLIWLIIKQLSPSGSVHRARYIPRSLPSRYISTTIHLPYARRCSYFGLGLPVVTISVAQTIYGSQLYVFLVTNA